MNKIIGKTFLEQHFKLAEMLKLDYEHIILDKSDYNKLMNWLYTNKISADNIVNNEFMNYKIDEEFNKDIINLDNEFDKLKQTLHSDFYIGR